MIFRESFPELFLFFSQVTDPIGNIYIIHWKRKYFHGFRFFESIPNWRLTNTLFSFIYHALIIFCFAYLKLNWLRWLLLEVFLHIFLFAFLSLSLSSLWKFLSLWNFSVTHREGDINYPRSHEKYSKIHFLFLEATPTSDRLHTFLQSLKLFFFFFFRFFTSRYVMWKFFTSLWAKISSNFFFDKFNVINSNKRVILE